MIIINISNLIIIFYLKKILNFYLNQSVKVEILNFFNI